MLLLTKVGLSGYNKMKNVVKPGGNTIDKFLDTNLDLSDCLMICEHTNGCHSLEYCPESKDCILKDKLIADSNEQTEERGTCFTAYKRHMDGIQNVFLIKFQAISKLYKS